MFGMGTGVTLAVRPPRNSGNWQKTSFTNFELKEATAGCGGFQPEVSNLQHPTSTICFHDMLGKFYGQAERPISTG